MIDPAALRGHVTSADGTAIAWWSYGSPAGRTERGGAGGPASRHPLLLIHGTTADHTTFRVLAPLLAAGLPEGGVAGRATHALDRRGREASGDAPAYAIEREFEDVAAVADAMAAEAGTGVDVLGHSYGGRIAMGAALLTASIRRVVSYEGAVPPGVGAGRPALIARLERLQADGRREELLHAFLTEVVEMTPAEWEAFRTSPVWLARLAAAHTIVRELRAGATTADAWERYAAVRGPVLQLLGSESAAFFRAGAEALDRRLPRGRIEVIAGGRHNAHHTHAAEMSGVVGGFLDEAEDA